MRENTMLPPERSAAGYNAGQFTGKQTLYTPKEQVLHMHIYCTSQLIAGEEGDRFDALTQAMTLAIGGAV